MDSKDSEEGNGMGKLEGDGAMTCKGEGGPWVRVWLDGSLSREIKALDSMETENKGDTEILADKAVSHV